MKLPIVKHILLFTTWGQKCPHKESEQFTFDNFQSNHPVEKAKSRGTEEEGIDEEGLAWAKNKIKAIVAVLCVYGNLKIAVETIALFLLLLLCLVWIEESLIDLKSWGEQ